MVRLVLSSILAAFAVPMNKNYISQDIDPFLVSLILCLSALVVFLPFSSSNQQMKKNFFRLMLIGSLEIGMMYVFFQLSMKFLNGHEVALLMLPTPIYVSIIDNFFSKKNTVRSGQFWTIACLSMACVIVMNIPERFSFNAAGVVFVQLCNISYAIGQVMLKRFFEKNTNFSVIETSSAMYIGATVVCLPFAVLSAFYGKYPAPSIQAVSRIFIFGAIFCGVAQYLWNTGMTKSNIRIVSVLNNLQIPMTIVVSKVVFRENIQLEKFVFALVLIISMFAACRVFSGKCSC